MAKKGLFEMLYAAKEEVLKNLRKGSVKRKLKRKMQAAWDSARDIKMDAEEALNKVREDLANYDCNAATKQHAQIRTAEQAMQDLEEEYKVMFGVEMPHEDVDDDDMDDDKDAEKPETTVKQ